MKYLRDLAEKTGTSFAYPKTSAAASKEIKRLLALPRSGGADRARDRRAVRADMANRSGGASRVRDEELSGYGSTAAWRGER